MHIIIEIIEFESEKCDLSVLTIMKLNFKSDKEEGIERKVKESPKELDQHVLIKLYQMCLFVFLRFTIWHV